MRAHELLDAGLVVLVEAARRIGARRIVVEVDASGAVTLHAAMTGDDGSLEVSRSAAATVSRAYAGPLPSEVVRGW